MGYKPLGPNEYQGKQVIINSDRLLFNAKEDSILLFSEHKGIFNIPYLYLGPIKNGNLPNEPALLGNKTEVWLKDLLDLIEGLVVKLESQFTPITSLPGLPTVPNPTNSVTFSTTKIQLNDLKTSIEEIKSKRINLL